MKFHENLISITLTEDVLLWFITQYIKGDTVNRTALYYAFKIESSCVGCITCTILISISLVLTCARNF